MNFCLLSIIAVFLCVGGAIAHPEPADLDYQVIITVWFGHKNFYFVFAGSYLHRPAAEGVFVNT